MTLFCNHHFVDGFGGVGDSLVCIHCGLDKYPESIPTAYMFAMLQRRIVREDHPKYKAFAEKARAARIRREATNMWRTP